jgi:hypothetical protein
MENHQHTPWLLRLVICALGVLLVIGHGRHGHPHRHHLLLPYHRLLVNYVAIDGLLCIVLPTISLITRTTITTDMMIEQIVMITTIATMDIERHLLWEDIQESTTATSLILDMIHRIHRIHRMHRIHRILMVHMIVIIIVVIIMIVNTIRTGMSMIGNTLVEEDVTEKGGVMVVVVVVVVIVARGEEGLVWR